MVLVASFKSRQQGILKRVLAVAVPGFMMIATTIAGCTGQAPNAQNSINKTNSPGTGIKTKVVHVGYQSSGDIVRLKGVLEKRLEPLGVKVEWAQFPAGPQLMEAMNVGKVDIGSAGETPPIFAQAAGASLVYLAGRQPSTGEGSGIVVPRDSPIQTVADLKGKRVIFQKGSASHYLLVKALDEVGLKYNDVQAVSMPPGDVREAFIQGKVEAWVTWDPHLAIAQKIANGRVLRDAKGIATQGGFYLASKQFAKENPELVRLILEEVDKLGQWAEANPQEVAQLLEPELKLDISLLETVSQRRRYRLRPITPELIAEQQRIADLFYSNKVLPKQIDLKEATLTPEEYAVITPTTISQK
ncbi:sulfonate ABC transporter substrate-binding protein [Trichocoleus sp. FACHB-591]|uniref:sulfonate ABC transporter substrate-binding protein n=1 Tax=Trichocoleus sp. FACHB-591 TaxID=2692872 RepID=UPI0016866743|nr:sulfonate ABC transporter substrate-binding protein [Trichocoleus sp. FACHB-591]MBD2095786.1 sulfonate ABC transporter substrate-binding protein [Trichocoleus sp. FACHB-591]